MLSDGKTKQNYTCYHSWFKMVAFGEVSNQKLSESRVLFASKPEVRATQTSAF